MIPQRLKVLGQHSKKDSGSVLIFGIGLSLLLLMLSALVISYASAWSKKITLQRISDAAVLSAVQAVDARSIYRDQLEKGVNLNSALAKEKAISYLHRPEVAKSISDVELVSLVTSGPRATIKLAAKVYLPFGDSTQTLRIFVTSSAIQKLDKS